MSKYDLIPENAFKYIVKDLSLEPYLEELNPFSPALSKIRLNECEHLKLNEFLKRAILAKSKDELEKIIDVALNLGIRINALNEDGFSFSDAMILKMFYHGSVEENIIKKLALNSADFDKHNNKNIVEICNKIKKEIKPQLYNHLKELREAAENAIIEGSVKNCEIDNKTVFIEFSDSSRINVVKVLEGARNLGLSKGNVKLGGSIIRIGNGERNYTDISDNSSFTVTFQTNLGELNVKVYHDGKNYDQIQVEVEDQDKWSKLQKTREIIGQGCLLGGISVKAAIEKVGFMRSGNQRFTEVIKNTEPKSNETISCADKIRSNKTSFIAR